MRFSVRLNVEKFYLDVVGADGSGCIGYATQVAGVALPFAPAVALTWGADSNEPAAQVRTLRGKLPRLDGDVWHWRCPKLAIAGDWRSRAAPVTEELWRDARGAVVWENLAPRAEVTLRVGDREFQGWGYAERLRLTIAPWHLPIDSLHWGRFISAGTSVVWISWEHETERNWLWHDGRPCELHAVSPDAVVWREGRIDLEARRVLRSGRLDETVFHRWPRAAAWLPARIRAFEETKWCSRATLRVGDAPPQTGWAIHEYVRFQ